MLRKIFLIILFFTFTCFASAPNLTPKDVNNKINEILKAHVCYKSLSTQLIERILRNFIEELDPSKMYFIEPDIATWLYPSEELKEKILRSILASDYSYFESIHSAMLSSIERRNKLEKTLEKAPLPAKVNFDEFNNIPWAQTIEELSSRIQKVKALQLETASKFDNSDDLNNVPVISQDAKDQFIMRINKRRANREAELKCSSPQDRKCLILSYVLKATACSLDAHTNYFTPSEANQFMIQVQQRLFGIGALLKDNLNGFCISRLLEGGPAAFSNMLKIGDLIIAVDNKPVIGMDINEAVELIRGEKGSKIKLTILRENKDKRQEKFDVDLTRGEVVLEESRIESTYEPYGDGVIAHIKLFSFYQDPKSSSSSDIKNAIEKIQKEHKLKGVILDLRNNSGGLLPQAVAVTGLFITKGIVVSIKENSNIQHLRATEENTVYDGPLVVLTNSASASASEIVAQTLQDYGRAIVVGDARTFGKGSFQTFTLDTTNNAKINPKGEYKVTRGLYYTVSGKSPQLVGVSADIVVPSILSELEVGEKYSKYPLQNDEISPNFDDDLSDVPQIYRKKLTLLYKNNLQKKLTLYKDYLEALKENSRGRISNNKNYQNFLKEIKNKHFDTPLVEMFSQTDPQLNETLNIIKDLIFMLELSEKRVACY